MFIDKKLVTTNKSGFTLVELIVVISILAILGTIAFLSFGWYSWSARDAKRAQNLDDVAKAITIGQANGNSLTSFVSAFAASKLTTGWLSGSSSLINYEAWNINATALGLKATDYQDPVSNDPYKIWVTTSAGWAFELAATMETLVNGGKAARVLWNFRSRTTTTWSAVVTAWTWTTTLTIATTDIGKLKVWDYVSAAWNPTTITGISADGTKITLAAAAWTTPETVVLSNSEVAWLVNSTTSGTPVADKSTTLFPYTVN